MKYKNENREPEMSTSDKSNTAKSGQIAANPIIKSQYLIKRKPTTSREELVAHWYANHMPQVIQSQQKAEEKGYPHALKYLVTLFDANEAGEHAWDGVAQLWWSKPLPPVKVPIGSEPTDTFQQKVEPYVPWDTREYVVMEGEDFLSAEPLTLNDPFPTTRSGFYKASFLVGASTIRNGEADADEFFAHWLGVHAANAETVMQQVGGFRYVVSHSLDPRQEPYAGMAELYFPDREAWLDFIQKLKPDGMEKWVDSSLVLGAVTQMIGIP
jgi:hypothetical protein